MDYVLLQPLLFFERGVFMSVFEEWMETKIWKGKKIKYKIGGIEIEQSCSTDS